MSTNVVDFGAARLNKLDERIGKLIGEIHEIDPLGLVSPVKMLEEIEAYLAANGLEPLAELPLEWREPA